MPLSNMIILITIVSAFTVFGLALAWAERQTRHSSRPESVRAHRKKQRR